VKHYRKIFFWLLLCANFLLSASPAAHADEDWQLRGIALVNITGKHVQLETNQVVSISHDRATFAALDELGGISFTVQFGAKTTTLVSPEGTTNLGRRRLKTLLSLPLTKDELLSIIRHENSGGFTITTSADSESWTKRSSVSVLYRDFLTATDGTTYPQHITITHKKNRFDLQWVKFERKP
jgi:hypothetical protein